MDALRKNNADKNNLLEVVVFFMMLAIVIATIAVFVGGLIGVIFSMFAVLGPSRLGFGEAWNQIGFVVSIIGSIVVFIVVSWLVLMTGINNMLSTIGRD